MAANPRAPPVTHEERGAPGAPHQRRLREHVRGKIGGASQFAPGWAGKGREARPTAR